MSTGRHLSIVLLALWVAAAPAGAQELIDRRPRDEFRIDHPGRVSLDSAVDMAQRRYRAKAVRAETERSGDRLIHKIRLLSTDGKVWTVRVDAESGAMH